MENLLSTVFVSYNWVSDDYVNDLCRELTGKAAVKRDKQEIGVWGSISTFMKSIRQQDLVVMVITDEYLKSDNCMYEVVQLMKDADWADKVCFVVMENARKIYHPEGRLEYVKFWLDRHQSLVSELEKTIGLLNENEDVRNRKECLEKISDVTPKS